jgi:phenylalanyl-tRNA synthetase beta chain
MLISYNWLKLYFEKELPQPNDLVDIINTRSFEVEGLEEKNSDHVIDVDVLPNRAHDCLGHYWMAKEVSVITGVKMVDSEFKPVESSDSAPSSPEIDVKVSDDFCRRYIGRQIKGLKITESPEELKQIMESIGQRSINTVVDITNMVMFELNQPMHAFDTDKLNGNINVRFAKEGESMITLDNKKVNSETGLDSDVPVIADDSDILAIAGVKGGKKAEVNTDTVNIILEAANFDPALVRKTSNKLGIKTDSSKRFENEITPELAERAIHRATEMILKYAGTDETVVHDLVDVYPNPVEQKKVSVSLNKINSLLGTQITETEVSEILNKFEFQFETNTIDDGVEFSVIIPYERLDLNIEADLIEEIGRIYGYDKIADQEISEMDFQAKNNTEYLVTSIIRKTLIENGFSEVVTYSFVEKGELQPVKPIANDKAFLRPDLKQGFDKALDLNVRNADWLGLEQIKIFEIGKIFSQKESGTGSEKLVLGIGVVNKQGIKKPKTGDVIKEAVDKIAAELGITIGIKVSQDDTFVEINLEKVLDKFDGNKNYADYPKEKNSKYSQISQYPFVLRDIAVWIPSSVEPAELLNIISSESGDLLIRTTLFDVYKKDEQTSYAYRLVFQSHEKTLTDEEIGKVMDSVNAKISEKGWEIR